MTHANRLAQIRAKHQKAVSEDLPPLSHVWSSSLEFLSDLAWLLTRVEQLEHFATSYRQHYAQTGGTMETFRALRDAIAKLDQHE